MWKSQPNSFFCLVLLAISGSIAMFVTTLQSEQLKVITYDHMIKRIRRIEGICGPLCDDSRKGTPGKYFDQITASVDCKALFEEVEIDAVREQGVSEAPYELPKEYKDAFLMHGRYRFGRYGQHFNEMYLSNEAKTKNWTFELIEGWKQKALQGQFQGNYGQSETNALIAGMRSAGLDGARVLVIGSENPWVEASALAVGASEVVTLEYGSINSAHPQVKTMLPSQFRQSYLDGTLGHFDAVVTYSSVEHSGLGRYGDAMLPWGDYIAVARGWCVTKPKGKLVIGVLSGSDGMEFNAHRAYGPVRYPYLVTNWKQLDRKDAVEPYIFLQPVYVLEKLENPI